MQFRKVTENSYLGQHGYTLYKGVDGSFSICKDGAITNWGIKFPTVRSAEIFLDSHDYQNATSSSIPLTLDDLEFVCEIYGLEQTKEDEYARAEFSIILDDPCLPTQVFVVTSASPESTSAEPFSNINSLLERLDEIVSSEDIFSSVIYRGVEYRQVLAANKRRSARDITKDLIRVKSSNVWAYGMEVNEDNTEVGDVYVQFKGKNGGPNGGVYKYYDVPKTVWKKFLTYPSKGAFVWKYLRNNFLYSKLTGDKRGVLPNAVNN